MLELKNISYKVDNKTILDDINLTFNYGKIYAITGISLENSVYYIYIFYKHYDTGELIFAPSDFDCIIWYIPN